MDDLDSALTSMEKFRRSNSNPYQSNDHSPMQSHPYSSQIPENLAVVISTSSASTEIQAFFNRYPPPLLAFLITLAISMLAVGLMLKRRPPRVQYPVNYLPNYLPVPFARHDKAADNGHLEGQAEQYGV